MGGLRPEPVAELIRRLTWDYAQLQVEYLKLKDATDETVEDVRQPRGRRAEAPAEAGESPERAAGRGRRAAAEASSASHTHPDELVRFALAAANREARELRESARADCEAMLHKAQMRTAKLERELQQLEKLREARLNELDRTLGALGEEIRTALQTILESAPEVAPRLAAVTSPAPDEDRDPAGPDREETAPPAPVPLLRRQK